jgi:hypothetical protein
MAIKSDPIQDGDFVIITRGDNKGQAAIVTNVIKSMADVYFPLRDVQKTLRLTSLHNRHPSIEGHQAFEAYKDQTRPKTPRRPSTPPPVPTIKILPPSVDAAIIALCEALDASHMEADDTFVAHVDSRLRSTRR